MSAVEVEEGRGVEDDETRSGLKDPARAVAALGAIMLGTEALVLLMALAPLRILLDDSGTAIWVVLALTVACVVAAGLIRRPWAWHLGSVIQVGLLASGVLHWALAGVGVIFAISWVFALSVRRKLSRPPVRVTQR
ncbi:DUF4233 domain-containing protein [Stackebrandtia soli]|uniref:DUF4233 domain-containing protein n=1 Tax=Stackebrandtia soli TaxID=1892856 RepID=UPI0039EC9F0D